MRDVRRILADLIIDGQLTDGERRALGSMLYPPLEPSQGEESGLNFETITNFLQEKFLGDAGLILPLASWLVGLMEDSLRKSFETWLKKFRR